MFIFFRNASNVEKHAARVKEALEEASDISNFLHQALWAPEPERSQKETNNHAFFRPSVVAEKT